MTDLGVGSSHDQRLLRRHHRMGGAAHRGRDRCSRRLDTDVGSVPFRGRPDVDLATASRSDGLVCATVSEALHSSEVDVLVDFTSASTVKDNVRTAVRAGVHVVIGTSGLTSKRLRGA